MGFVKDFKAFALRGNVLDLAVAVIIGGAFGKIVSSFVSDVLMPPLGILLGGIDFKDYKLVLKGATEAAEAVTLNYGMFVQNIIDFLIIAFSIFLVIHMAQKMQKKAEEAPPTPASPNRSEILLEEIRDLLKK